MKHSIPSQSSRLLRELHPLPNEETAQQCWKNNKNDSRQKCDKHESSRSSYPVLQFRLGLSREGRSVS